MKINKKPTRTPIIGYLDRLRSFDADFFDRDFEANEESWADLQKIKGAFPELYGQVLYNIFNRNHDT